MEIARTLVWSCNWSCRVSGEPIQFMCSCYQRYLLAGDLQCIRAETHADVSACLGYSQLSSGISTRPIGSTLFKRLKTG